MATRYFVPEGSRATLVRVHDTTAAERLLYGGTWQPYPALIRLAFDLGEMGWDEITAREAARIEARIAAKVA